MNAVDEVGLGAEVGLELEEEVVHNAGHVVLVALGEGPSCAVPAKGTGRGWAWARASQPIRNECAWVQHGERVWGGGTGGTERLLWTRNRAPLASW